MRSNGRIQLLLASASPARLATLRAAGVDPRVCVSGVDESGIDAGSPAETARELARLKCATVLRSTTNPLDSSDRVFVLGGDSVLEMGGATMGKPTSPDDARARWRRMRGRSGVLHSGLAVGEVGGAEPLARLSSTIVHFAEVDDDEIDAYVATGEPSNVAGAFTIDGLGGPFVTGVEGDHHTVVGLPLPLLRETLAEFGLRWSDLWRQ